MTTCTVATGELETCNVRKLEHRQVPQLVTYAFVHLEQVGYCRRGEPSKRQPNAA